MAVKQHNMKKHEEKSFMSELASLAIMQQQDEAKKGGSFMTQLAGMALQDEATPKASKKMHNLAMMTMASP